MKHDSDASWLGTKYAGYDHWQVSDEQWAAWLDRHRERVQHEARQ